MKNCRVQTKAAEINRIDNTRRCGGRGASTSIRCWCGGGRPRFGRRFVGWSFFRWSFFGWGFLAWRLLFITRHLAAIGDLKVIGF
jgi:hypothetical protein